MTETTPSWRGILEWCTTRGYSLACRGERTSHDPVQRTLEAPDPDKEAAAAPESVSHGP